MDNEIGRVDLNQTVDESLRFRSYVPSIEMKDLRLAEKVQLDIINDSAKSLSVGVLEMELNIPANTLLSEVTASGDIDFTLEMLDDGKALITVDLEVLSPREERFVEFDIYFAGAMTSPSYKLDCSAKLLVERVVTDAVAMDSVLRITNTAPF